MNRKFQIFGLVLITALVSAVTAFSTNAALAVRQVQAIGPFWRSSAQYDSLTALQPGGRVVIAINSESTDSMRIGQVVFWQDTNKVQISSTLANYNTIAGVVVGGASTAMQAGTSISDTSTLAAIPGAKVLILTNGRTWVLNDNNGAITIGQRIIPSDAQQGRAEVVTGAIDTNYRVIGKAVVPAAASKAILTDVNIK